MFHFMQRAADRRLRRRTTCSRSTRYVCRCTIPATTRTHSKYVYFKSIKIILCITNYIYLHFYMYTREYKSKDRSYGKDTCECGHNRKWVLECLFWITWTVSLSHWRISPFLHLLLIRLCLLLPLLIPLILRSPPPSGYFWSSCSA